MTEEKLSILSLSVRRDADAISQCCAMLSKCVADKDYAGTERIALVLSAHCRELAGRVYGTFRATRPDHGAAGLTVRKKPLNLRTFVREVVSDASVYVRDGKDIVCCSNLGDDFEFESDPFLLRTALLELLKNSLCSIPGGHVILKTKLCERKKSGRLVFEVCDCGPGIPEEHRERIFDWFYKVDPNRGGMGCGLALCRSIAGLLGGSVELDRHYSSGTIMNLEIPKV